MRGLFGISISVVCTQEVFAPRDDSDDDEEQKAKKKEARDLLKKEWAQNCGTTAPGVESPADAGNFWKSRYLFVQMRGNYRYVFSTGLGP